MKSIRTKTRNFSVTTSTFTAILCMLALLPAAIHAQTTIFVDADATGAGNGSSWTDAFTDLQAALATATGSDQIWIAEGTYKPTSGTDRTISFTVTGADDGLEIYGGFTGTETMLSQRGVAANPVIFSGDIDADGTSAGNSNHVLFFDGTTGGTITTATALDGVTVTGGNADGSFPDNAGGGLHCQGNGSGNDCSPTIRSTTFTGNSASFGGAIYNDGSNFGNTSPAITNSTFSGNSATGSGGAVYNNGNSGGTSSPAITNSTFTSNSADDGGAIYNVGFSGVSSPLITNSILSGNSATIGAEIFNNGSGATPTHSHTLIEGVLFGISENNGSSTTDGGGNIDADPLFVNAADPNGPDDIFGTADDGLALQVGSPAADVGDNAALPPDTQDLDGDANTTEPIPFDIIGAARIQNSTVNMGAYEIIVDVPQTIYVDTDATGANNGTSWANAYTSLQDALGAATGNDEIWIAEGTYYPDVGTGITDNDRGASFTVTGADDGLEIYGGFAGTETMLSQRDVAANPVIFSGDIDGDGTLTDNSYHVLFFDGTTGGTISNTTVLDGVTVTGGNADDTFFPNNAAGGLFCDGAGSGNECSPTIRNATFFGNSASNTGGAISNNGVNGGASSPAITNSTFTGNSATNGGAIYNNGSSGGSSPMITGNTFTGNTGTGGAMLNFAANPAITNSILYNNGSEIFNNGATPTISHSLVEGSGGSTSWDTGFGTDGGGNIDADPLFVNAADPNGPDDIFGTADDGLALQVGSPAADVGDNAALPPDTQDLDGDANTTEPIPFDIIGAARIQNSTVNMGAYESILIPISIAGRSLSFDGTDDYVEVADDNTLDLSNNFTLEAWVKPQILGSGIQRVMSKTDAYGFGFSGSTLRFTTYGILDYDVSYTLKANQWVHLACVLDANNDAHFYVNGVQVGTSNGSSPANVSAGSLDFGSGSGIEYLNGQIDEVRIWNIVRTQEQIQQNMFQALEGDETGLIAYYPFNEETGPEAVDATANDNSGTLNGGVTQSTDTHPYGTFIVGNEGWRMMAAPTNGVSYGTLLDTLWTQGFTGADVSGGSSNVYRWNETAQQFESIANATDVPAAGTGFIFYVYADDDPDAGGQGGFPKIIMVDSAQNSGTITPTLTWTNTGVADSIGWNLVGNPYGATIDWDAATGWTKANLNAPVYVWSDSAGGAGAYLTSSGGAGTLSGGLIAPFQGFWVQASGADPALEFTDDVRSAGGAFYKQTPVPQIQFRLDGTELHSNAILMLHEQGEAGKDPLDAWKLQSLNADYLSLYTTTPEGHALDINALPLEIEQPLELTMNFEGSDLGGSYTLSWNPKDLPQTWPQGAVILTDLYTDRIIALDQPGKYTFEVESGKARGSGVQPPPNNGRLSLGESAGPQKQRPDGKPAHGPIPTVLKAKASNPRFLLTLNPAGSTHRLAGIPESIELKQNYPNPFNPETVIRYGVPQQTRVQLNVYDILGRKVATLLNEQKTPGRYQVNFDASRFASGLYIYRLKVDGNVLTKKMMLIK